MNEKNPLRFYVYAYLRSKDSATAKAGTPYYIGKGQGKRAFAKHGNLRLPSNINDIVFLEFNLSDVGACALERRYIKWYGKKCDSTGILLNMQDGGDGSAGLKRSAEWMKNNTGKNHHMYGKAHSEITRKRISDSLTGNTSSIETRNKQSNASKGKKKSDKHRENMRKPQPQIECVHCGVIGGINLMSRYHHDKCKLKNN